VFIHLDCRFLRRIHGVFENVLAGNHPGLFRRQYTKRLSIAADRVIRCPTRFGPQGHVILEEFAGCGRRHVSWQFDEHVYVWMPSAFATPGLFQNLPGGLDAILQLELLGFTAKAYVCFCQSLERCRQQVVSSVWDGQDQSGNCATSSVDTISPRHNSIALHSQDPRSAAWARMCALTSESLALYILGFCIAITRA